MDAIEVVKFAGAAVGGAVVTLVGVYRFFAPRSECALKHLAIDEALEQRRSGTHELRDIVTPLVTDVALLKNELGHLTTVVESIAEKVGANGFVPRTRRQR